MIAIAIHWIFRTYTVLLVMRIALSWFPNLHQYRFSHFVKFYTDPYLNIFRKIIPPIGGMLDISPMLAFFVLQFVEKLFFNFLR